MTKTSRTALTLIAAIAASRAALSQLTTTHYPSVRTGSMAPTQFGPGTLARIGSITTDESAQQGFIGCSIAGNGFHTSATLRIAPFPNSAQSMLQQCVAPRGVQPPTSAAHGDQLALRCIGVNDVMIADQLERCGGLPTADPGVLLSGFQPQVVLRENGTIAGLPGGVTLAPPFPLNFWYRSPARSLIQAAVRGSGVTAANDVLLAVSPNAGSNPTLLAREGETLAGVNLPIESLGGGAAATNNGYLFWGVIAPPLATAQNNTAIFRNSGASPACDLWLREDAFVPGPNGPLLLGDIPPHARFSSNLVAFITTLRGPRVTPSDDLALIASRPGQVTIAAREGSPAPGITGAIFSTFTGLAIGRNGGPLVFAATLAGPNVTPDTDESLWLAISPGQTVLIAREGDPAPNTPAGTVFDSFASMDWDQLFVNDQNDVTFRANVRGPSVNAANDTGLWQRILDQTGLVVREGDPYSLGAGVTKTIAELRWSETSSGDDGEPRMSASYATRVVFGLVFTDGDHAAGFAQSDLTCATVTHSLYNQVIRPGDYLYLSAGARGIGPLTYQWNKDSVPLHDDGRISGSQSSYLTIYPYEPSDAGSYTCEVTNPCRTVETGAYEVSTFCAADFNQDGGVDGADADAFFSSWQEGYTWADVNADGGVDGADVEFFFSLWEAGGC